MKTCPWCGALITTVYSNGKVALHCGRADCLRKHKRLRWRLKAGYSSRRDPAYTREEVVKVPEPLSLTQLLYESGWVSWYHELWDGHAYTLDSVDLTHA